jgi:hypothetical protein
MGPADDDDEVNLAGHALGGVLALGRGVADCVGDHELSGDGQQVVNKPAEGADALGGLADDGHAMTNGEVGQVLWALHDGGAPTGMLPDGLGFRVVWFAKHEHVVACVLEASRLTLGPGNEGAGGIDQLEVPLVGAVVDSGADTVRPEHESRSKRHLIHAIDGLEALLTKALDDLAVVYQRALGVQPASLVGLLDGPVDGTAYPEAEASVLSKHYLHRDHLTGCCHGAGSARGGMGDGALGAASLGRSIRADGSRRNHARSQRDGRLGRRIWPHPETSPRAARASRRTARTSGVRRPGGSAVGRGPISMTRIQRTFADPPKCYRVQPFWFLNQGFDEAELRRQIGEMDEKGVGGAVLHCRHGLRVEYMSDDWMAMVGVCVDELGKRGMEAWLYDEDDWPSGTVGGRLTRAHPEFRMRYLRLQELRVNGGVTFQTTLRPYDNTLVCVQAWPYEEVEFGIKPAGEPQDLTRNYSDGKLQWQAPPGKWLVAVFWECPVAERVTFDRGYYLDTMNPEAVGQFRSMSYDPYLRFSEQFGKAIKGIFTDEPGLMIHDGFFGVEAMRTSVGDPHGTLPGIVLAWTRDMLPRFQELKGYDLKPRLLALAYELGPETAKLRADYYDALTQWYIEAYHGNLSGWAAEHGIEYIGHTLEDPLWGAARSQGNQVQVLEQFHRPGLDYLGHGVGTRESPYRILAAKCAASVAHIQGKPRVMCEAFGGSGHAHTLANRRLDANFMACLGVNMFIPHGYYFSFQGFRKSDWPPTEFYHSPWWPWYSHFADYLGRLSVVQSTGHHVSDALVLQPMRTVQVDLFRGGQAVLDPPAQQVFNRVSDLLLRMHHDYDYVDEAQLARAQVREGRIAFEGSAETYGLLVLPGCRVLSLKTARFVEQFVAGGGKVVALGKLPSESDKRGDDADLREAVAAVFGEPPIGEEGRRTHEGGGVAVTRPDVGDDLELWLRQTLPQLVTPDLIIDDRDRIPVEDMIACHRTDGKRDYYLVVNRTKGPLWGVLRMGAQGRLEEWSLETGQVKAMTGTRVEEGRLCQEVDLDPAEARLFVVTPQGGAETSSQATANAPEAAPAKVIAEIALSPQWEFETAEDNVLVLSRWQVGLRDPDAARVHGLGVPGQANRYSSTFEVRVRPSRLKLVFEDLQQTIPSHVGFLSHRRDLEVCINGRPAPALGPAQWQDPYFLATDIADLVVEGENTIDVDIISLLEEPRALSDPAYLVGDFSLAEGVLEAARAQMDRPFTEMGYPFYAGIARYRQTLDLSPDHALGCRVLLDPGEVSDCCRVVVNGTEVAVRLWEPFQVDISGAVQPGRNTIVVEVANTLANLYAGESRAGGLRGPARLWVTR